MERVSVGYRAHGLCVFRASLVHIMLVFNAGKQVKMKAINGFGGGPEQ